MGREIEVVTAGFGGGGELVRLAQLDDIADQADRDTRPFNTQRSYATVWRQWSDYTAQAGIPVLANTRGALVGWVAWLAEGGRRPDTIRHRLHVVCALLKERGAAPEPEAKEKAHRQIDRHEKQLRNHGRLPDKRRAPAMTTDHVRAMVAAQHPTLTGLRNRAVVTWLYWNAARRSELAMAMDFDEPIGLMVDDITPHPLGLSVNLRVCKTTARTVALVARPGDLACPVAAYTAWKQAAGLTSGFAFRRMSRHANPRVTEHGISDRMVRRILEEAAIAAGLGHLGLTGHSGRRGFTTDAVESGANPKQVAAVTGHVPNSRELWEYYELRDAWEANPSNRIR